MRRGVSLQNFHLKNAFAWNKSFPQGNARELSPFPQFLVSQAVLNHPQQASSNMRRCSVCIWASPPSPSSHHHIVTFNLLEFTHVLPASNLLLSAHTSEPTSSRSDALTFRLSASWPLPCFPLLTSLADEDSLVLSPGPKETLLWSFHVDPKSYQLLPSSSLPVIWESGMGQGHREGKDWVRFCWTYMPI